MAPVRITAHLDTVRQRYRRSPRDHRERLMQKLQLELFPWQLDALGREGVGDLTMKRNPVRR